MWSFSISTSQRAQTCLICDHKLYTATALGGALLIFSPVHCRLQIVSVMRSFSNPLGTSDSRGEALLSAHDHCQSKELQPHTHRKWDWKDMSQRHEKDLQATNYNIYSGAIINITEVLCLLISYWFILRLHSLGANIALYTTLNLGLFDSFRY